MRHLETYAASFRAPVLTNTGVRQVAGGSDGYRVDTDRGSWTARSVVIATGPGEQPNLPDSSWRPDPGVHVVPASRYRNPHAASARRGAGGRSLLLGGPDRGRAGTSGPPGGGGRRAPHPCPAQLPGMDLFWWLERTGRLARTIDEVADVAAARREPSLQLVGRGTPGAAPPDLDLGTLQARGVRLTGRVAGIDGTAVQLQDDLGHSIGDAERRLERLLDSVDRHIDEHGLTAEVWPAREAAPGPRPGGAFRDGPAGRRDRTVLLATGYRPHRPWLRVPVTAADGSIVQYRGVTRAPGLYVVGQRFQHRRDSSFLDGARHDAAAVVGHLPVPGWPAVADRAAVMTSRYDAVVVGGRVAGASTALLLARAGARVALLERSPRGSDTVSTHALMRGGVLQLSRWGLLPDLVRAGTPPIRRTLFHYIGETRRCRCRSAAARGSTRCTRRAGTSSTRCWWTRRRRPGWTSSTG